MKRVGNILYFVTVIFFSIIYFNCKKIFLFSSFESLIISILGIIFILVHDIYAKLDKRGF